MGKCLGNAVRYYIITLNHHYFEYPKFFLCLNLTTETFFREILNFGISFKSPGRQGNNDACPHTVEYYKLISSCCTTVDPIFIFHWLLEHCYE